MCLCQIVYMCLYKWNIPMNLKPIISGVIDDIFYVYLLCLLLIKKQVDIDHILDLDLKVGLETIDLYNKVDFVEFPSEQELKRLLLLDPHKKFKVSLGKYVTSTEYMNNYTVLYKLIRLGDYDESMLTLLLK
jgi:hypothetical protein